MSGAAGGANGIGPNLRAIMNQRQGGVMNQNSVGSNTVAPSAPVTGGNTFPTSGMHPQTGQPFPQSQSQPQPNPAAVQSGMTPEQQQAQMGDPETMLILGAMEDYIKHKAKVGEAKAGIVK